MLSAVCMWALGCEAVMSFLETGGVFKLFGLELGGDGFMRLGAEWGRLCEGVREQLFII